MKRSNQNEYEKCHFDCDSDDKRIVILSMCESCLLGYVEGILEQLPVLFNVTDGVSKKNRIVFDNETLNLLHILYERVTKKSLSVNKKFHKEHTR